MEKFSRTLGEDDFKNYRLTTLFSHVTIMAVNKKAIYPSYSFENKVRKFLPNHQKRFDYGGII